MVDRVLSMMGISRPLQAERFQSKEDGAFYDVWHIRTPQNDFVLKQAKDREVDIYRNFFADGCDFAPELYKTASFDGKTYLLISYIPGADLMKCHRDDLMKTLDALIGMQTQYWMESDRIGSFDNALSNRKNRKKYLNDSRLEAAYEAYLDRFQTMPKTLCHDDLLPFNVIVTPRKAVFIDWEAGGILPYMTSFVRLIAHCREDSQAFFYMTDSDKAFAVDYYFEQFAKKLGISRSQYQHDLDLFLLHEYCEWVYVCNKYGDTDSQRFREYHYLALKQAELLSF